MGHPNAAPRVRESRLHGSRLYARRMRCALGAGTWILVSGILGCGDEGAAPQNIVIEGLVTNVAGAPVEGALINLIYEFVPETAQGNASTNLSASPNPFDGMTTLQFEVTEPADGSLEVFDANNNLVRSLLLTTFARGTYQAGWNGRDDGNRLLPSGLYHARLVLESANAETRDEFRIFHNTANPMALAETWVTRTDADGEFRIAVRSLPRGESFIEANAQGIVLGTVMVDDMITVWATVPGMSPRHASTRISMAQNVFVELRPQ